MRKIYYVKKQKRTELKAALQKEEQTDRHDHFVTWNDMELWVVQRRDKHVGEGRE